MKRVISLLVPIVMFGAVLSLSALPQVVEAQGLVPEACQDNVQGCNFCNFVKMVNNIIQLFFEVLAVAATVLLVVAGFKLVTSAGNVSAMQQAKEMFTNVVIGFVIVLAAWLIVDTIVKALMGDNPKFGPWNEFTGSCDMPAVKINPAPKETPNYDYGIGGPQ